MFNASTYANFVSEQTKARERLILTYMGGRNDFDVIIVGSGMGGGVLADDLAERAGGYRRILVIEAGSFIYPTHVYNFSRIPNTAIAQHYACDVFTQQGNAGSEHFIGGMPQLNFGGRSIFWSGLIPTVQSWELDFFPPAVRAALTAGLLTRAGARMNESRSMGTVADAIVQQLRQSELNADFSIQETPRALHQPYLAADGTPTGKYFTEPTGVFNTAELLVNQLGLTPGVSHGDYAGLQLLLNYFVEDVIDDGGTYQLVCRNTLDNSIRTLTAPVVVLAAGSIESAKLLQRSTAGRGLPASTRNLMGQGLTDHPTSSEIETEVDGIGNVDIDRQVHAKIIFYSRGLRAANGETRYPFNVEMNINHEYWHLRENDPDEKPLPGANDAPKLAIKFSFGNPLDASNHIKPAPPFGYMPEIVFRNQSWTSHLTGSRFPALAGWQKSDSDVWAVLNDVTHRIFSQFRKGGQPARPAGEVWYGQGGKGFGWGTVHHAAGSLRMPARPSRDAPFAAESVVNEDLQVVGSRSLYVCDMSVMPFSTAANPVRTLVALALRLSERLA